MRTATIAQVPSKGLFADSLHKIRAFAIELYAAHGGWFVHDAAQPSSVAIARANQIKG
jgi:hypothetical protein